MVTLKSIAKIIIALTLLLLCVPAPAQASGLPAHPRLFLDDASLADYRSKLASEGIAYESLRQMDAIVMAKAEEAFADNKEIKKVSDKNKILNALLPMAYACRAHGRQDMLPKLKKNLSEICNCDWGSGSLVPAETSTAVSLTYDWIWAELDEAERDIVRNKLRDRIIRHSPTLYDPCKGNWTSVCNCGAVMACLALYDECGELAESVLQERLQNIRENLEIVYAGGGYPEGINYWSYGSEYQVCIIEALKSVFGQDFGLSEIPGFKESAFFPLYAHSPLGTFSFSDGGGTYANPIPASWWFAADQKNPTLAFAEKRLLDSGKYSEHFPRILPAMLPLIAGFDPDSKGFAAPENDFWSCGGEAPLCVVRKGWNNGASDIYLGIKGGYADTWNTMATSHGHMDAGSFVFEAEGVRWSDDMTRPSYGPMFGALKKAGSRSGDTFQSGLRWSVFNLSNLAHSCLIASCNDGSVPDKLHPTDYSVVGKAELEPINEAGRQGAALDMCAPMKGQVKSAKRTIVLLAGGSLEVTDEVEALPGMDCPIEWRMLSKAEASLAGKGIILKSGEAQRRLSVKSSARKTVPEYAVIAAEVPESWKGGFNFIQPLKGRTIVSWHAVVPAGRKVTFVTRLER